MKHHMSRQSQPSIFFTKFVRSDIKKKLQQYRTSSSEYWKKAGEHHALSLFKEMSEHVPAYKDFLKKSHINPKTVRSIKDFHNIPPVDKKNYIDRNTLSDLCWGGKIETSSTLSTSSGSTGVPYFWPRSDEQTGHGAGISEAVYRAYYDMDTTPTLYIDAFAMGTWIAGTYMMMATQWVAQKGYPITVVTPGINKDEILRLITMGVKYYKQIVLIGYPPFIKDVIDTGTDSGINWKKIPMRFMFSGEAFTERWRSYLHAKLPQLNILTDAINIYGSADIGLVAHETAVSIFVRRLASENESLRSELFHAERVPSFNQYDPTLRYFEVIEDHLHVTARSGIPLIRYNTKDIGGLASFQEIDGAVNIAGKNLKKEFTSRGIGNLLWKLPFVYLFGRGKFTAIIYGANIYPEHVKLVVEHATLEAKLTGKFVILTEETSDHGQQLILHIELRSNTDSSPLLSTQIRKVFIEELTAINSEYRNNIRTLKEKVHPTVVLHEYGDPQYFPRGIIKKLA
jgi:phenylacetate-CoA ligase